LDSKTLYVGGLAKDQQRLRGIEKTIRLYKTAKLNRVKRGWTKGGGTKEERMKQGKKAPVIVRMQIRYHGQGYIFKKLRGGE